MPELHIEVRGRGPALVMLHGWAMHGGIFAPLSTRLEAHFTLHLVDLPGHGRSAGSPMPLTLDGVARAIAARTPPALWLGWSLGGLVALHAAQTQPGATRGLVMLCASPRFVREASWPLGMDGSVFGGFATALADDYRGTIDRFLMLEAQGSDRMREEVRLLRDQVFACGEPSLARLAEGLALLRHSDLRAGLPALAVPSLWIAGRRDRLVSGAAMQAAAALVGTAGDPPSEQASVEACSGINGRRAQYLRIEHGGHAPFLTHADEVAAAILAFAGGVPA